MGRSKKSTKVGPTLRTKPIIAALQDLAREFAKKDEGRKKLQTYTGLSKGGLDGLLYLGKGAPATWINVFLCVFDLTPESAVDSLKDLEVSVKKGARADAADKRWFQLTRNWSSDTKDYWLSILEHATRLREENFPKEK
jgi:hypothetical protein